MSSSSFWKFLYTNCCIVLFLGEFFCIYDKSKLLKKNGGSQGMNVAINYFVWPYGLKDK